MDVGRRAVETARVNVGRAGVTSHFQAASLGVFVGLQGLLEQPGFQARNITASWAVGRVMGGRDCCWVFVYRQHTRRVKPARERTVAQGSCCLLMSGTEPSNRETVVDILGSKATLYF
ncbi:hypothetical protein RRG08_055060 [Elysia crispata]|uniref:Uncharacterized protein n=1 Tax=Elysia crispata TaxID=231223 RepID=A0AAE1AZI2_9GAST|nr:hypothetical protein RRG08_055060 [Elysia crispata]